MHVILRILNIFLCLAAETKPVEKPVEIDKSKQEKLDGMLFIYYFLTNISFTEQTKSAEKTG
jgi:hypothetical protein